MPQMRTIASAPLTQPRRRRFALFAVLSVSTVLGACSSADSAFVDFDVAVGAERFVLRVEDAGTIAQARDVIAGRRSSFPIGRLVRGDGGFNAPWSWHLDPSEVRLTEVAIEVCDGTPSYVEAHISDFPTYCPWSARVTAERR